MFEAAMALPDGARRRDAFWKIVQINDALIQHIVNATCARLGRGATEDDLQIGRIGMYEAVRRWRPQVARLSTYAMWWIRVSLQRGSHHPAGAHVPADLQALRPMVLECERFLAVQGRAHGAQEIAEYLEVPLPQVQFALSLNSGVEALELQERRNAGPGNNEIEGRWDDESSIRGANPAAPTLPMEDLLQLHGPRMRAILAQLGERERVLLTAFANGESYSEMGQRVGLSRERTRQVLDACLQTVRSAHIVVDEEARRRKLMARLQGFEEDNDDFLPKP